MFKIAKPFFILTETPLHAGSGSDLGIVDLPIQRERHTQFPKIEASGIKGCMREVFTRKEKINSNILDLLFGPEIVPGKEAHAGALGFTDARLLLFPVRSAKDVFAWITCPQVLNKFSQEINLTQNEQMPPIPTSLSVPEKCQLLINAEKSVILEEYRFDVQKNKVCTQWAEWLAQNIFPADNSFDYWRNKLKTNLVILEDDDFRDFVNLSTEVITRTKINNKTGTVQPGALFTEEYLPQETVLYSLALASSLFVKEEEKDIFKDSKAEEKAVLDFWQKEVPEVIQIGGNATIGKGLARIKIM